MMKSVRIWLGLSAVALVAVACVPRPAAPPEPPAPTAPAPQPTAPTPPPPAPAHWRDAPLSPGGWSYRRESAFSAAQFGPAGAQPSLVVRCDLQRRQLVLARSGASTAGAMTVRTTFGARNLPATAQAGTHPALVAMLAASDPLLDTIAFSRGRFTIEAAGMPMLIIPAWPEPARVIEDCRI